MAGWTRYIDEATNTPYYCNNETGETTWELQDGYISDEKVDRRGDSDLLPPRWRRFVDESSGKPYYHDEVNDVVQWDQPKDFLVEDTIEKQYSPRHESKHSPNDDSKCVKENHDQSRANSDIMGNGDEENSNFNVDHSETRDEGSVDTSNSIHWVKHIDRSTQKPYYHNVKTNVTQWEEPEKFIEAKEAPAISPEYLEYLQRSQSRIAEQSMDPHGNLSRLNSILSKIDNCHCSSTDIPLDDESPQWQQHVDAQSQRYYYHNTTTGETQWEEPDAPFISALADWDPTTTQVSEQPTIAREQRTTVTGEAYVTQAKFNRLTGKYEKLGGEDYFLAAGVATDKAGRQMSHFFDLNGLEKNREDAKRIKEELKRKNINWKKVAAEKKAKKQKQRNEWLFRD